MCKKQKVLRVFFLMVIVVIVTEFSIFEARSQTVFMVVGQVFEPAGLKQGDNVIPGQFITTGADGVVILEYTWPSNQPGLICVSYIGIKFSTQRVPTLQTSPNCQSNNNYQLALKQLLNRSFRGMSSPATFYAVPGKGDSWSKFPKHIEDSMNQEDFFKSILYQSFYP
jgi:hypothetical protein